MRYFTDVVIELLVVDGLVIVVYSGRRVFKRSTALLQVSMFSLDWQPVDLLPLVSDDQHCHHCQ
jgi:hypothetical protein